MSFLAPLYALGALAIALPILFHLIQRRPRGQQPFSSLMFLSPSPPRLTRRSRLDNLLLLLLRASALILLAVAFARPFVRSFLHQLGDLPTRQVVILVDASASMRRGDLWQQVMDEAAKIAGDLEARDQLALLSFDSQVQTLIPLNLSPRGVRSPYADQVKAALSSIQPTWNSTDLGQALISALDVFHTRDSSSNSASAGKRIVLISDLQMGSRLDKLENSRWPEDIGLVLRSVTCDRPSNAGVKRLVAESEESKESKALRIRVLNDERSRVEQFELAWRLDDGRLDETRRHSVHVPAGQQRVVRVVQHPASKELVLAGDDHDFDNRLFVPRPARGKKTLLYLGLQSESADSLYYFLKRAPLDTPRYQVVVESKWPPAMLAGLTPSKTPLVVTPQPVPEHDVAPLRRYVQEGGRVLIVLDRQADPTPSPMEEAIAGLLDVRTVGIREANVKDYAMFSKITFRNALFRSFADRRFNDFTKIHVWRHRQLSSDHEHPWDVLIQFDDGTPALVECTLGQGHFWVLTTGWQPSESQLALSTKFVPILAGMFDENQDVLFTPADYEVGHVVSFPEVNGQVEIERPNGETRQLASTPVQFRDTGLPGIYAVRQGGERDEFAINLDANESKTAPMDTVQLEQRGVRLVDYRDRAELQRQDRQLKDFELESRQQLWRWLIVIVLCALFGETMLAGRLTRILSTSKGGDQ